LKTLFYKALVLFGIAAPLTALSDIQLNGPGKSGQTVNYLTANVVPFESQNNPANQVTIPVYKFVFRGLEAQISLPPGDKQQTLNLAATVEYEGVNNSKVSYPLKLNANKNGSLTGQSLLSTPQEFKGLTGPVNIIISWTGGGKATMPSGYFNILGEYQPAPPKPTGSLLGLPALVATLDRNTPVTVKCTANVIWQ
jgi:hypothetical protein